MQAQSLIHQLIAAGFFMGAAAHCYSFTYAIIQAKFSGPTSAEHSVVGLNRLVSWPGTLLKCLICGGTFVASPAAEFLHPAAAAARGSQAEADNFQFSLAGIVQYVTVGLYILFFGSYSFDLLFFQYDYLADSSDSASADAESKKGEASKKKD